MRPTEQLLEHIPETELTEVTHTIVRNGRVAAEFRARQVRNFPRAGRTELNDVIYSEYDRSGILLTAGNAARAVYYTAREDARGGRRDPPALAVAGRLAAKRRPCAGRTRATGCPRAPRRRWRLPRDDGSQVTGTGLEVDVRRKTIRFSGRVSGTLVAETTAEE